MAQVIISIAASGDDAFRQRTSTAYPPVTPGASATSTLLNPRKTFATPNYNSLVEFLRFDTSVLPDDATITGAALRLICGGSANVDTRNINFEWYSWTPSLVDGDYTDLVGTTAAVVAISTFPGGNAQHDVTLSNPDANINKTGFTGIRLGIDGGAPTGNNEKFFMSWDHATLAEPKLVVDYTVPGPQFDLATEFERTGTTDPQTWTHTTSASPKGVVVAVVHGTSSTDHVSTVTYGGVSMGEVTRAVDTTTEAGAAELWFLGTGIPTGNQTVSVDLASGTTDDIHFMCFTVTADADTEVIDFDLLQAENANPVVTLSKGGRLGWSVAAMYGGGSAPGGTVQAGNTLGPNFDLGVFYSQSCYETTTDASDQAIGWSTLGADDLAFVALCLAEVVTVSFVPRITTYVS